MSDLNEDGSIHWTPSNKEKLKLLEDSDKVLKSWREMKLTDEDSELPKIDVVDDYPPFNLLDDLDQKLKTAVLLGNYDNVQKSIIEGANVNQRLSDGNSLIERAGLDKNYGIVALLAEAGARF